jgi:hypothetical protein
VKQVSYSRKDRLAGDLVDSMFFQKGGALSAPYFYGYLYLRRLYQEWTKRIPDLKFTDFSYAATKLICRVLPQTLLPLYSLSDFPSLYHEFPILFGEMLAGFLSMGRADIEFLRDTDKLIIWSLTEKRMAPLPNQINPTEDYETAFETRIFSEIVWSVFELREAKESTLETYRVLNEIERAKFLLRTASRKVVILAVDEEQNVAFIADPSRATWNEEKTRIVSFDRSAATFFKFQDDSVFKQFLGIVESPGEKLLRQELGAVPYKFSKVKHMVVADLQTFYWLWPYGVPQKGGTLSSPPAVIVRVLICGKAPELRAFLSGPPVPDLAALIKSRDWINKQLLQGIRQSLDQEQDVPLEITAIIADTYDKDSLAGIAARAVLDQFQAYDISVPKSAAMSGYSKLLFPASRREEEPELSERKLDALIDEFQEDDRVHLRRWIHGGLVLHPERSWVPDSEVQKEETLGAIMRIRNASNKKLGIPLVKWSEERNRVELDLIPR